MNKFLLLLLLPMLLFAGIDTAYVHKLETGFNYEVWGNVIAVDSLDTLFINTAFKIGNNNLFSLEMIHGDSIDVDYFPAALTTDMALKPWAWIDLNTFLAADSAKSYYWNEDTLAFDIYCWFRLAELAGVDRDTIYFRFKMHTY